MVKRCTNCGRQNIDSTQYCISCGRSLAIEPVGSQNPTQIPSNLSPNYQPPNYNYSPNYNYPPNYNTGYAPGKPGKIWYLVPIFFGIIGGVVAWLCVKEEDPQFAHKLLIVGIIDFVIQIAITLILIFVVLHTLSNLIPIYDDGTYFNTQTLFN